MTFDLTTPFFWHVLVLDANGNPVRDAYEVDTWTGIVGRYKRNSDGKLYGAGGDEAGPARETVAIPGLHVKCRDNCGQCPAALADPERKGAA